MVLYRDSIIYNDPTKTYRGGPAASQDLTSIRLHDENGVYLCEIPDVENLQFQETLNGESSWSFDYPRNTGSNFSQLVSEKDRSFSVRLPGGGYYWGLLEEDSWEEVDKQEGKASFSGRGTEGLLDYALVYPAAGIGGDPNQFSGYSFINKTIGFIMKTLYVWPKVRGVLPSMSINYNEFHDSANQAWAVNNYTIDIPRGLTVLTVLKELSEKGWFDWRMNGHRLEIFNPDSATGLSADRTGVIFRRGIHIQKVPRQRSRKDIGTVVMVAGQDSLVVERKDDVAIATRGRKEKFLDEGSITDANLLNSIGDKTLTTSKQLRLAKTASVSYGDLRPKTDFNAGDFVYTDINDGVVEKFRVISYSYSFLPKANGELALNDRFAEIEVKMQRAIDKISLAGGSGSPTEPVPGKDLGIPNAPGGVGFTSDTYENSSGNKEASIIISWAAVTTNTDGTVANDIDSYFPEWKFDTDTTWNVAQSFEASYSVAGLPVGRTVQVRVRARDEARHVSAYSLTFAGVTATDVTPPPLPSVPVGDGRVGFASVYWDGLDFNGNAMPFDFDHINIYYSFIDNADIANSVLCGQLRGAGSLQVNDLPYNQFVYFRFASVDKDNNESDLTDSGNCFILTVNGGDIATNTITTNHLQAGSVTAAKISANEISANRVSFGASTNLIPDPSFGDAETRADRLTLAEIPARWQFSNFAGGVLSPSSGYYLEAFGDATDQTAGFIELTGWFGVHAYEKYYLKMWARKWTSANATAQVYMALRVLRTDGTVVHRGGAVAPFDTNWHRYWTTVELQPGDVQAKFVVTTMVHTGGSMFFDEVECRNATNNAVENGASSRIEITPLGIFAENSNGDTTFELDAEFGDVTARGTLKSGFDGKRIEINPGFTYLPEVRFYPQTGSQYAYINASDNGFYPFIGMNAPDDAVTDISNAAILFDTISQFGAVDKSLGAVQSGIQVQGMTKATAEVIIYGKMSYSSEAHRLFSGGRWNVGIPATGSASIVPVLTKPNTPSSGVWALIGTVQWNSGEKFTWHPTGETATTTTIIIHPNTATFATGSPPAMLLNFLFVRCDSF